MVNVALSSIKSKDFTQKDIHRVLARAMDQLNFTFKDFHSVIIKPNLCYYWDYSTGETTDPRLVAALIDYIREQFGSVPIIIAEADASAMRTKYAFTMLGYKKLAQEKRVQLVNLSQGQIDEKEIQIRRKQLKFKVNRILGDTNLVVNVPKLKYHRFVGVTCGLKNIFGTISTPRKLRYHKNIAEAIVGINKLVKSDLTIVDGIIAKGKYPKKLGVVLISDDVLKADHLTAKILGYNSSRIDHMKLANEEKVGNIFDIELASDGPSIKDLQSLMPKENYRIQNLSWNMQLKLLSLYSKALGDVIPPALT